MTDRSRYPLGKKPPRLDGALALTTYADVLPKPKPSVDNWAGVPATPMFQNDVKSNCTFAGAGHAEQEWSWWGKPYRQPTDAQLDVGYELLSPNDDGCVMRDVLDYWRKTGIAGNKIAAFVKVNPLNTAHVKLAIDLFGGLYTGVALPLSAQTQNWCWTVKTGPSAVLGSWGGHCIWIPKYNSQRVFDITWGEELRMSWTFFRKYVDECWAIVDQSWLGADKVSPAGLNVAQLLADAKAL